MKKARQVSFCAVLIALALALSYTERLLPLQLLIPLPGIKLGLANIVSLVILYLMKTRYAWIVMGCRCVLGAIFGGGITGLLFSMCGGILSLCTMSIARKQKLFSIYGVSILGAAAHNIGQILAAMVLMDSMFVGAYLPYLLLVSLVTGFITGGICAGILRVFPKAVAALPENMCRSRL